MSTSTSTSASTSTSRGTLEEQVVRTLQQLHDNHPHSAAPSMKKYFDCFTPTARFLGTEESDNWSMAEYKRYLVPMYNSGQRVIPVKPVEESRKISLCGDFFASFDEVLLGYDAKGFLNSELRGSGSMVREEGGGGEGLVWKIALYHLSVPIPNDAAVAVGNHLQQPHPFPSSVAPPTDKLSPSPQDTVTTGSSSEDVNPSSSSSKKKKKKNKK